MVWLRSDDFKKRAAEWKRRANETPAEKQKRLQQLDRHEAERRAIQSRNGSSKPTSISESESGTDSIVQLTLPIWFRERQREFLQETDPEWQACLQFQQDQKKVREVYTKVYNMVAPQLRHPSHQLQLQYIAASGNVGANFEMVVPILKPIGYYVLCIRFGRLPAGRNIDVAWSALPSAGSAKIQRMFHPVVFSQAFFAGVKAFSFTTFYITKAKILDQLHGPEPSRMSVSMVQKDSRKIVTHLAIEKGLSREQQLITQLPINRLPEKQAKPALPFLKGGPVAHESIMKTNYRSVISSTTYSEAIEHASGVFKQSWLDGQISAVQDTTKGLVVIKGHLDCFGQHGRYRLEVAAFYLPGQDGFVGAPQITNAYIMPDLTGKGLEALRGTARKAPVQLSGKHDNADKTTPVHQPPPPAEKPSPNRDAGK